MKRAQCEAAVNCYHEKQKRLWIKIGEGNRPYDEYTYELLRTDNLKYKVECLMTERLSTLGLKMEDKVNKIRLGYTGTKWEWIEGTSKNGDDPETNIDRGSETYNEIMTCFNK